MARLACSDDTTASRLPQISSLPGGDNRALSAEHARLLTLLALGLLALGAVCRLVRYLLAPPLWCDEVFVTLNFVGADYRRLTGPLEFGQIAPVVFLWMELAAYRLLGSSEWALRLLPLLAGLACLPLFWHLARTTLPPLGATLAAGTLAVARWPMALSNLAKPYSLDLLLSLTLLTLAVHWLRRPDRLRYLALLAALAPLALLTSYPVVFVVGSVSLVLCRAAWRGGWRTRLLFLAYNLAAAAAFAGGMRIGASQLGPDGGAVRAYYQDCWREGFLPTDSLRAAAGWLLRTHTGELMAYPAGDRNGLGTPTLLLVLAGVWWVRKHRRRWLALWLLPFGLALAAAALRRYPYGAEPRLDQHLAPSICLLAGAGAAALIERFARTASARMGWAGGACAVLAGCGVAVSFLGTSKPSYWEREALWCSKVANELRNQVEAGDRIVVLEAERQVMPALRWQLLRLGPRVSWGGEVDAERLRGDGGRLCLLSNRVGPGRAYSHRLTPPDGAAALWVPPVAAGPSRPADQELADCLGRAGGNWLPADHAAYNLQSKDVEAPPVRCDLYLYVREGTPDTRPRFLLSCWPR